MIVGFFAGGDDHSSLNPKNLGTGSTIFSVQVASLFVSNYAFERMVGTHG
jgi:hypothetical protein